MQIGIRWGAGAVPHTSVPESVHPAILEIDQDGYSGSWTLTWLENRPVCTRDDDTKVTLNAHGVVMVTYPGNELEDDDDWLME